MAKTKTIVVQSDTVGQEDCITAPQMKDFWRMVGDGTINRRRFQGFLGSPSKFEPETVTIARATNTLGSSKVLTVAKVAEVWGMSIPADVPIRYSEEDLRQAAAENKAGADWRLVYFTGQSLREQYAKRGDNTKNQPCFYKSWDWWLKSEQDEWANQKPAFGYYLIDFRGRFGRTSWDAQNGEIAKLGSDFLRTHEAVIVEVAMSFFMATGERLLKDFYHWGPSLASGGGRVLVGRFGDDGLGVGRYGPVYGDRAYLRVCLSRKFRS
ncbi:MAG: hypothetical protein G01um101420_69 [Parcubacteria group bacterium Gr01-1014_20]|nr:MAG: hypothetical protein G01um101420_69 [Parcubacteria group bacterium Gr01-1014_20]